MLYVVQENVNKNDCMHLKCEVSLNTLHNMTCLCAIYLCSLIKVQLRKTMDRSQFSLQNML